MKLKLISCQVFRREIDQVLSKSPNQLDVQFLTMGLHNLPAQGLREQVQTVIDEVAADCYEAILIGYGMCNGGLAGVRARHTPLVFPRAHDCINVFFGGRQPYLDYFMSHPGSYFQTTGWIDHRTDSEPIPQLAGQGAAPDKKTLEDFIEQYGEDNGRYLWETLGNEMGHYRQFTFIEMGVEPDTSHRETVQRQAEAKGLKFDRVTGDISFLQRLVDGPWDSSEFLLVPPGHRIAASYQDTIVEALPPEDSSGQ